MSVLILCGRYVSFIEIGLISRCFDCGRDNDSCAALHARRNNDSLLESAVSFFPLFLHQMVKTREHAELVLNDEFFYIGLLCFAVPVHELALAVERVSAGINGVTEERQSFGMALEGIHSGLQQLFESDLDTSAGLQIGDERVQSADQFIEMFNRDPQMFDCMHGNQFNMAVEHLQRILELNLHQPNFINRSADARLIYSALSSQLEEVLEPARDEANPQIILSEKLKPLLDRLASGCPDHDPSPMEALLGICKMDKAAKLFPERMTLGSAIGILSFFILANSDECLELFIAHLCISLCLDCDNSERYTCQVWSARFFDPPCTPRGQSGPDSLAAMFSDYMQAQKMRGSDDGSDRLEPGNGMLEEDSFAAGAMTQELSAWSLRQNLFHF